jgi:hypothetical protein
VDRRGGPCPSVHRGPIKGVRALLIWAVRADRMALAVRERRAAAARRRRAKWGSRAPFSMASAWRGRGGGGETLRQLGRKEGRPEQEIDVAALAWELGRTAINGGGGRLGGGRLRGGEGVEAVRVGGGGALIRARWGGEGTRGCRGRRDGRGGGTAGSRRRRAENWTEHRRKRHSRARGHDLGCGRLYAELGRRQTYLGGRGGGFGGHGGSQRKGAAAATLARKHKMGSAVCVRQMEGRGSSPRYDTQGEENSDREATSRKIDDSGGGLRNRAELDVFLRRRRRFRGAGSP